MRALLFSSGSSTPRTGLGGEEEHPFLKPADEDDTLGENETGFIEAGTSAKDEGKLGFRETAKLSFEFCILWVRASNPLLQGELLTGA